ncbi:MAG: hypothetical protein ABR584_12490 [Candidatus Baltobacteraceae bacterium]
MTAQYLPLPPGKPSPRWGTVPGLLELFGGRCGKTRVLDRVTHRCFPSLDAWVETFRSYFGPVQSAFTRLDGEKRDEYERKLREIVMTYNRATDGRRPLQRRTLTSSSSANLHY